MKLKRKCATAARFAEVFIRYATMRAVVGEPRLAPRMIGIAASGPKRPFCDMTTTRPVVTELDWKMLVMTNPNAICKKTVSIMATSAISCGSVRYGIMTADMRESEKKTRPK